MVVLNVTNVFRLQVDHWSKTLYFLTTMAGGRHMGSYMPVRIFNLFYCVRRSMRCSTVLRALHQMKTGRGWQTFLASRSTSPLSFQSAPLAFRFELQNFPLVFFQYYIHVITLWHFRVTVGLTTMPWQYHVTGSQTGPTWDSSPRSSRRSATTSTGK